MSYRSDVCIVGIVTSQKREFFSSRLGFILSIMGVAIGAGNIWRFSRVVAQNGGGSFLIPWVLFLFLWSIPLLWTEIAMGKKTRKAPIGTMAEMAGPSFGWMGAFIALVTTGILFYYSVVVGWGFRYFFYSITGTFTKTADFSALWESYTHSYQPFFFHVGAILIGSYVIYKGISHGIEKSNKVMIPALIVMILIIALRAFTLPGAGKGIAYFFTPHLSDLLHYRIWIEALTQNAWDTGAGWGLILVYSGYIHKKESVTVNGCWTAVGNNVVSLVMGMTIFATAFAIEHRFGLEALVMGEGSSNTGLTFVYLPQLFQSLPGGVGVHATFASIFFLGFSIAALSSMISMLQLTTQVFAELGLKKNHAILVTGGLALVLGAPSALNMAIFDNQDWVWSLGLIVNGLFLAFAVIRFGPEKFRKKVLLTSPKDFKVGKIYNWAIAFLIPLQGVILIVWYFYKSFRESRTWWNPLHVYSLGTILFQWGIALLLFFCLNRWLVKKTLGESDDPKRTV
ncbi:MAG: hypothetical protein K940chlam9_00433 [Chlamydiae bacterium]|nr:hypothetical protein [Chlamydiota bacterium]